MLGERGHVAVPIARVLAIACGAGLLSVLVDGGGGDDRHRHAHGPDAAARRQPDLHQLMLYAVDGVALGGWQLVDLALMALVAIELLSLIFLKVVIILLGALLYATGPITIGLVATESGAAIARAWASAVVMLIALPVVWATLFAVGALLVGDAGTAGPLIAGQQLDRLAARRRAARGRRRRVAVDVPSGRARGDGAVADAARRTARAQPPRLGTAARRHDRAQSSSVTRCAVSARRWRRRPSGAAGELAAAGPAGATVVRGGRAVGYVGRHGVLGTAAAGGRAAAAVAAPHAAALVGRSRAGAVAVRMAKAGTASWHAAPARRNRRRHANGRAELTRRRRGPTAAGPGPRRQPRARSRRPVRRPRRAAVPPRQTASAATADPAGRRPARAPAQPRARARERHSASPTPPLPRPATAHKPAPPRASPRRRRAAETARVGASDDADAAAAQRPRALLRADAGRAGSRSRLPGAILYGAVRVSPFGLRATVTVVVLALAFLASIALALQGQTIGPGRYLLALYRYRRATKQLAPPTEPDKHGLVLDVAPSDAVEHEPRSRRGAGMTGSLADLLPISVLEPDGLIVTTAGSVRAADRVRAGTERGHGRPGHARDRSSGPTRTSAGRFPTTRGSSSTRKPIPVPLKEALAGDLELTQAAADRRSRRRPSRARATLASGCSRRRPRPCSPPPAPSSRPSRRAGGSRSPTCRGSRPAREQLRSLAARSRGRTLWSAHREAAIESARVSVADRGRAARRRHRDLSAGRYADARAAVGAAPPRDDTEMRPATCSRAACQVATATTTEQARNARHRVVLAACEGAVCGIDAGEDAGWLRHADGTLEEVLHLGSPPAYTDASWLSHLLCCPLPGHARRAHLRRRSRPRASAAAPPVEAAARSGALQGAPRPRRRIRRARGARRSRRRRRGARRRDRRERLPSRDLLLDPRPARPRSSSSAAPSSRPPSSSTRSPTPA